MVSFTMQKVWRGLWLHGANVVGTDYLRDILWSVRYLGEFLGILKG